MTDSVTEWRHMWGAKVSVPCDMDMDQLKNTVEKAKEVLKDLSPGSEPSQDHAAEIKNFCDDCYGRSWQVVVGRHFGVHAIHDVKHFAFFYIGEAAVLVLRTQ
mmetsp:Transcript_36/g.126  ORF Transcript_36/g.126 Transcript_36/m.126 type:complete len:103 (+) Transcript_36:168-476(+)|eukprot:CAMPEP_0171503264 /NCGR_PEP_ID=MMETSP0958-20121227/10763_1 /TAXON_ID=87120 /ORGANISM="Aurantiochytrium limacinum, Strain ATCCMYA-1381" /LENGTH=102 /DNA_ID=CAMNT_0012038663 /DNA_START=14 /DNA_END=322 /DNA_ORIENTATION=-